jgi:hypothetical protein
MTDKQIFEKNLILSTEFDRYVMEHPEIAEKIPQNAQIVLLPADDEELCAKNLRLAQNQREPGQKVVYVHVGSLAPQLSRLTNVSVEVKVA